MLSILDVVFLILTTIIQGECVCVYVYDHFINKEADVQKKTHLRLVMCQQWEAD